MNIRLKPYRISWGFSNCKLLNNYWIDKLISNGCRHGSHCITEKHLAFSPFIYMVFINTSSWMFHNALTFSCFLFNIFTASNEGAHFQRTKVQYFIRIVSITVSYFLVSRILFIIFFWGVMIHEEFGVIGPYRNNNNGIPNMELNEPLLESRNLISKFFLISVKGYLLTYVNYLTYI